MGALELQVITPEGVRLREQVRSARLQGVDGAFGILPRHAPMLSALAAGVLRLELAGGGELSVAIGDGFAEVSGDQVRVVTEFANLTEDIDRQRAEAARDRARERLRRRRDPQVDLARAEAALARAIARLKVGPKV